ncbi:hypothetical protein HMPREF9431_00679 [Segatella oulorum F0390]|uniref:Uncharacterized protein n=1 Tax=Segatella oulorum F0390 TaxID=702438 RepID=G1WA28_9BACT|nr:hypothetical protein [Segatella oulorum]EGV33844.1 hypothetical protein HMPREF9431_00679 [Segatella oulorum F0390]
MSSLHTFLDTTRFIRLVGYDGDLLPRSIILQLIRFYQYDHK